MAANPASKPRAPQKFESQKKHLRIEGFSNAPSLLFWKNQLLCVSPVSGFLTSSSGLCSPASLKNRHSYILSEAQWIRCLKYSWWNDKHCLEEVTALEHVGCSRDNPLQSEHGIYYLFKLCFQILGISGQKIDILTDTAQKNNEILSKWVLFHFL